MGASEKEVQALDGLEGVLAQSLTLHVAADFPKYKDGLLRFIGA